jgi:hypothetical protein
VQFLELLLSPLASSSRLFSLGAGAYRQRWDVILNRLGAQSLGLTPGGLRGGGAVEAFMREGLSLPGLLWRMRLRRQETLEHYLQHVLSRQVIKQLSPAGKDRIRLLSELYEGMVSWAISRLKADVWSPIARDLQMGPLVP